MNRRTFLSVGGATLGSVLCPRLALAQSKTRAAIVIGVDKAGALPVLRAAASGSAAFADWIEGEGFEVTRFIDGPDRKVLVNPIFEAVERIVSKGVYEQLVVYFSGHGFLNGSRELWMLSGAPNNPNQAISLLECERLCKRSGIPNVVFISDACRSTVTSLAANAVRGSVIFPAAPNSGNVITKVDNFLAAKEGNPAYEVSVDVASAGHHGIFTASFLNAYKVPEENMVTTVDGVEVILNKDLEGYLRRDVNRRAQLISIALTQQPESNVLSNKYIGRVRRTGEKVTLPRPEATISEVAALAFSEKGFGHLAEAHVGDADQIRSSVKSKDFARAAETIISAEQQAPKSFETGAGLSVTGIDVAEVVVNHDLYREEMATNRGSGAIRLHPRSTEPASVAIRFSDGSGTVVAALRDYIGTIVVDEGRVVSVAYRRSGMETAGVHEEELIKLRTLVATSARFGTFRIPGTGEERERRARDLADRIRMLKMVDPTLGIYASYAYADADMPSQIKSVRDFMRHDINGQIFDVALLANELSDVPLPARQGIAPFCPMLSQGWGLLRIGNVVLHPDIDRARDHLKPALWTTFRERGMDLVIDAMRRDRVI